MSKRNKPEVKQIQIQVETVRNKSSWEMLSPAKGIKPDRLWESESCKENAQTHLQEGVVKPSRFCKLIKFLQQHAEVAQAFTRTYSQRRPISLVTAL